MGNGNVWQRLITKTQTQSKIEKIFKSLIFPLGFVLSLTLFLGACGETKQKYNSPDNSNFETMNAKEFCNANPEQLAGIEKALDAYVEAAVKGDSKIAKPYFTENATMSHIENDSLLSVPIQVLFDYYDNECPQKASYKIFRL